jgi:hypothetical protein
VEAGHKFRLVDDVATVGKFADSDRIFRKIHKGSLFGLPSSGTENGPYAKHLNHGIFQGTAICFNGYRPCHFGKAA